MRKIAVVSHVLPPSWSGQAVVIYRLIKDLDPAEYCLIGGSAYQEMYRGDFTGVPKGRTYYLPPDVSLLARDRIRGPLRDMLALFGIPVRAIRIARIVRRERCSVVVGFTGDLATLPAAFLASRLAGASFYAYMVDDYVEREFASPIKRRLAEIFERIFVKRSAGIVTPNELLRDEVARRRGVLPSVIRNSCDLAPYTAPLNGAVQRDRSTSIVFTGDIYEAHYDAFVSLLAAIELLDRDVNLHVYSARPPARLGDLGIRGSVVFHEHRPTEHVSEIQRRADLLFLPLAFHSPYPRLVRTSAPTKIGEYLAARRPVLVHAPGDSFVARYFRLHECGLVVARQDPNELAGAIESILNDATFQQKLVQNAWHRAQVDFDMKIAQAQFASLLGITGDPDG